MNPTARQVQQTYHLPASNTAAALALFDNRAPAGLSAVERRRVRAGSGD